MARSPELSRRLRQRLEIHQALHDARLEPRNRLPELAEVRRWQARRLQHSFQQFLDDPRRTAAARFFLTDVYGDHDFTRRDADIARVMPAMQRVLPASLLSTVADGITLGVLTQALDLRMAAWLSQESGGSSLDAGRYAAAYRAVGLPRLRHHQIDLVHEVGAGLGRALRIPGLRSMLRLARGPAQAAGLHELQAFLERGVAAFGELGDAAAFLADIEHSEREVARRLQAGEPDPFSGFV